MPGGQHAPELTSPEDIKLWDQLCKHSGETFTTSGRGNRAGVEFKYEIKGADMFVSSRFKSITRSLHLKKVENAYLGVNCGKLHSAEVNCL